MVREVFVEDATACGKAEGRSPFAAPAGGGKDNVLIQVASLVVPSRGRFRSQASTTSLAYVLQSGNGYMAGSLDLVLPRMVRCWLLGVPHLQPPAEVARSLSSPRHVPRFP